jgi:predicted nucleic acid-binding protein
MPAVVVDTHTIVWYLSADPRLSANAADALDSATAAGERIHVPSICLVELTYLVEKGRLPVAARERLIHALDDPAVPCLLAQPSQLEGFAGDKSFRISEGYPKVFTTKKGAGDLF